MFLVIAFAAILLVTFGAVTLATGTSRSQRTVDRRITALVATAGEDDSMVPPQMKLLLKPQPTGTLGILNSMLQEYKLPRMLETKIIQADLKTSALIIILSSLGCAALGFVCAFIWVPILAIQIIVALVFTCFPMIYVSVMASRRLKKFNAGLADAIDMMARALRAGH